MEATNVFAIHGFTGLCEDFPGTVGIPLPGHLKVDEPCSYDYALELVDQKITPNATLIGYSMGARVALRYALKYPNKISKLILISPNPGIKDESQRFKRKEADEALAQKIESIGTAEFIKYWQSQPLIADQQDSMDSQKYSERLAKCSEHNPQGLANCLRALGQGSSEPLWDRLGELSMPVALYTGSKDEKYCQISKRIKSLITDCQHLVIEGQGHAPHFKKPNLYQSA